MDQQMLQPSRLLKEEVPMARRSSVFVVAVFAALVLPEVARSEAAPDTAPHGVVVRLREAMADSELRELAARCGASDVRGLGPKRPGAVSARLARWHLLTVPSEGSHDLVLACLQRDARVEHAVLDREVPTFAVPDDPGFRLQWGLRNIGQTSGYQDADVDAADAWDLETGSGAVIVAVIDGGVDYTHPDLAGSMWTNPGEIPGNAFDDDSNGWDDDVHGIDLIGQDGDPMPVSDPHGTAVAGVVAAVGNNGLGVAGVSWNSQLMALRSSGFFSHAVAIHYAVDHGARVINASWGCFVGTSCDPVLVELLGDAITYAGESEVLLVAAAGNCNNSRCGEKRDIDNFPIFPAALPHDNIIAVAATGQHDELNTFSMFGGTSVDLGAPGFEILTTFPGAEYGYADGTSMAAPHVAGAAALLLEAEPNLTAAQVKASLLDSVDPISALTDRTVTGGRLNVARALGAIASSIDGAHARYVANRKALALDGVDDHVTLATLPDLFGDTTAERFSLSVWVKMLETPNQYSGVLSASSSPLTTDGLGVLWLPSGNLAFYAAGVNQRVEASDVKPEVWNHLVATYDGTLSADHLKLYLNGTLVDALGLSGSVSLPDVPLEIGRLQSYLPPLFTDPNVRNVHAAVDDMALWRVALSGDEVSALYNRGGVTDLVRRGGTYVSSEELLGYWRLGDETLGAETRDVTERHVATSVDMSPGAIVEDVPQRFASRSSVGFDGDDDYAAGPDADDLLGSSVSELSMAFWVRARSTPTAWDGLVVATSNAFGSDGFGAVFAGASSVRVFVGGLNGHSALQATLDPDVWNHVSMTFDSALPSGNVRLFVNGSLAATANRSTALSVPAAPIEVGRFDSEIPGLNGPNLRNAHAFIDEVAVWSDALSDGEVAALAAESVALDLERAGGSYASHLSLAAAWRMGEGAVGTTVPDVVGSLDLTLVDTASDAIGGEVAQRYDSSLHFDGEDDRVALASLADLLGDEVDAFSVSLWFKMDEDACGLFFNIPDALTGTNSDLAYADGGDGFEIEWYINKLSFTVRTGDPAALEADTAQALATVPDAGVWNHVAAIYDGGASTDNVRIYVNGQTYSTADLSGDLLLPRRVLEIGRVAINGRSSRSWIDELAVFNRPLSLDEVDEIADGEGATNLLAASGDYDPSGLVGYWKMGERSGGLVVPDELGRFDGVMMNHPSNAIAGDVPSDPGPDSGATICGL